MEQSVGGGGGQKERKKDENRLHVAEMRIGTRWISAKTRKGHVRNRALQRDAGVYQISTFPRLKDYIGMDT